MKAFFGVLVVLASLLLWQPCAQAKTSQAKTVNGCLTAENGLLLLKQGGGHAYVLQGNTGEMNKYLDHTVQVQGTPETPKDKTKIGAALRVQSWKVTGDCRQGLSALARPSPAWKKSGEPAVPIAGKAGQKQAEVPVTSNRSVGETTPPSDINRNRIPPPQPPQPGQPPSAEGIGQSPADANPMAIAAKRAEIGTSNGTLGVSAQPGSGAAASQQNRVRPAAIVRVEENAYQPAKLTISAGQAVAWKNTTGDPHTVTVVPDKALLPRDVALPKDAQPFDSGVIPAGMSFVHTFTVRGTYRYYCTLHEGNGMVGEVVVR